jgi:hypothetical protein
MIRRLPDGVVGWTFSRFDGWARWSGRVAGLRSLLTYLFERGGVGREVRVADLAVEVDDEFELADRPVEISVRPVDHRDVVPGDRFAGAVADFQADE